MAIVELPDKATDFRSKFRGKWVKNWKVGFLPKNAQFWTDLQVKKLPFAELSDKANHMSKINVRLIGTAQW